VTVVHFRALEGTTRDGRLAFGLATAAVAWGALLIIAALVAPAYSGESCSATTNGSTSCSRYAQTFVEVNGAHALLLVALPLAFALLAWLVLHAKCSRGLRGAGEAATIFGVGLLWFSVLTGFSIGYFALPMALLVFAAAGRTPYGTHRAPR
jgi:hypothetical protein